MVEEIIIKKDFTDDNIIRILVVRRGSIIKELSEYRKFRHYYHCKGGERRVKELLRAFEFAPVMEVLSQTDLLND